MTGTASSLRERLGPYFRSPGAMIVVALALRLILMTFVYPQQLSLDRDHFDFGSEMGRIARSIVTGQGFSNPYPEPTGPTALVAPVYPFLLAGVFKVFGIYTTASAFAILTLNDLFSAFTCLPVFLIARRIFGLRVAVWSGWVWVFFPWSVALGNLWVWDITLVTLLLTLLLLATLRLESPASYGAWVGYGLLWALAGLTNPAALSTLPFLGAWIWWRHKKRGGNCTGQAAVASLVFLVLMAPWLVRNYRVFGEFIPVRDGFGMEFLVGNNDDSSVPAAEKMLPADNHIELEKVQQVGEAAYMAEKNEAAKAFVARHPLRFMGLTLRRIVFTWTNMWDFHVTWAPDEFGLPNILTTSLFSLLAFFGLFRAIREDRIGAIPLAIMLLCFPAVYYLTHPHLRYRHPIDPEVVICAVYGVMFFRGRETDSPVKL
jgi:4-amino-4-deoxy-L-arabinose transferase-like glycosyltransferase